MAVNQTLYPTLADHAKRLDPNGKVDTIVEILNQTNEVLDDMVWTEGNTETGHKTTIRSGLPSVTWRKLYQGVQPSKSTTVQVTETCGNLEAYAQVDKGIADLNGNTAEFRMSEEQPFIEAMSQEMVDVLFYGNDSIDNAKFTGLAARFNSLSAESGQNIIDAGGTGSDNTSIWLVVWGKNTVHGIYPKGQKAGLDMTDKGQVTIEAGGGAYYEGYRSHYQWQCGLVVRDWRFVVRIANIDVSNLSTGSDPVAARKALIDHMVKATELVQNLSGGRAVFYCNRGVRTALRQGILDKTSNNLTQENVAGKLVTMFDGVPVRRVDQILNTEARVV